MIKREFERRYISKYGEEWLRRLKEVLKEPYPKYIRVNTLKIKPRELISRLKEKGFEFKKIDGINYGFQLVEEPFSISSTIEHLLGYFYIQDKASMFPVIELDPRPTEIVLDPTSAPGGKTTHISQLMNNNGVVIASDPNKERIKSLLFNIQRLGIKNVAVFNIDAREVKKIGLKYDKILIDAPCSATGTMWKEKKRAKEVNLHKVNLYSNLQKEIVEKTSKVLKEGGKMVYSTCSMEPEENEDVVEFAKTIGFKLIKKRTFFPHTDNTIGFFYAVLKKS